MTEPPGAPRSATAARAPRPAANPAATALLDSALVVLGWLAFTLLVGGGRRLLAYDAFRDMAYAHAILDGRLGQDPTLLALPAWYPPGNPLAFAWASRLTRVSVNTLYATSVYWLGWTNALALYWLARRAWGRLAAWLALPCALFGSYWVLLHAIMPMPSVQAVALVLATLIAWQDGAQGRRVALALAAVLGALTAWVHPLCGAFALGSIALHGGLAPLLTPRDAAGRLLALRALGVLAIGGALAAPALQPMLAAQVVNDAPRHWFAPELHDPAFALMAHAPLLWPVALVGLALAIRDWRQQGWLAAWFVLGALGMLLGYAAHDLHWNVPWLIPHEFQWHAQLALGLAAAFGITRIATRITTLLAVRLDARARRPAAFARPGWALALALLVAGPGALVAPDAARFVMVLDDRWQRFMTMSQELAAQTGPGAVIAAPPEVSYFVAGFTGLRAVALPAGHTNPVTDPFVRYGDVDSLLQTNDRLRFDSLATRYSLGAVLLPFTDSTVLARQRAREQTWGMLARITLSDSSAWLADRLRPARGSKGTTP